MRFCTRYLPKTNPRKVVEEARRAMECVLRCAPIRHGGDEKEGKRKRAEGGNREGEKGGGKGISRQRMKRRLANES